LKVTTLFTFGLMDVSWGRVNTLSSQGLQLTIDSLIAFCNVQDEEKDEVSADSSQNSEDGSEEDEEVDPVDQWHPRNPYQVRMDLPDVLTDALF